MSNRFIPFARPYIGETTIEAVSEVLRSGWLTNGPQVEAFELALSKHCGNRSVRTFSSGSSALLAALRLAGIGQGDEVITTPLTWVATANVIIESGARPVFVDVDPLTRNIDLKKIPGALSKQVRAILPVDLAGLPVDREQLSELAQSYSLRIIADAAQSFGASWNDKPIGSYGDFVAFSFHANKNITCGEGGALVLPADIDPRNCERLRLQGVQRFSDGTYDVDLIGMKANLSEVAATIGLCQLDLLTKINSHRIDLAKAYFRYLPCDLGIELPVADFKNCNWHMFQVLIPDYVVRSEFIEKMRVMNVGVGVHYPAVHLLAAYQRLGFSHGDFPIAERISQKIVSLPMHTGMTISDVQRVCTTIEKALQ